MQPFLEYFEPSGAPREHVRPLLDYIAKKCAGRGEMMRQTVRSRLREQEVSYNLLGTPGGSARPWQVDEVPHIIPGAEFRELSARLSERALLLGACLQDLYGEALILKERVVPSEVVLGNPNYYRPLRDLPPLAPTRLILYAADVVRDPSGQYVVHSDRSAAPTGAGYALENRLVVGQLWGDVFREWQVTKINAYFQEMRAALERLSPRVGQAPRIVVLTPGVQDESSFEHAYLARYQGFELVEGRDLTVRGDEVFLKTLDGLKPVDVILRRVTDGFCDPLELRDDSFIGVSGLLSAVRTGKVGIANPLGSGLIESPAFRAYLPELARVLGKPLGLESIPTRYLGDRRHLEEVLDTLDVWRIRPAFGDRREESPLAGTLSAKEKADLIHLIRKDGSQLVAESWPEASRVPVGAELQKTGAFVLRLFACYTGDGYSVMPGGLGRVNDTPDGLFLLPGNTTTSKDVWVIGEGPNVAPTLPRMPEVKLAIRRGGVNVPSRLFDDIYWLGRYSARASAAAKLIRVAMGPMTTEVSETPKDVADFLRRALRVLRMSAGVEDQKLSSALLEAIAAPSAENSIKNCLERIHWLTAETRSRLSIDTWGSLRRVTGWSSRLSQNFPAEQDSPAQMAEVLVLVEEIYFALSAFHGVTKNSMTRGPAWIFLDTGRRIEHAVFVLTLLLEAFRNQGQEGRVPLETLLVICDSLMTYRARYLSSLQPAPATDLVLTDHTNPQSVIFQVQGMLQNLTALPQENTFPLSPARQRLVRLEARLLTVDPEALTRDGAEGLLSLAEDTLTSLWQFSDDLTQAYFAHSTPVRVQGGPGTIEQPVSEL